VLFFLEELNTVLLAWFGDDDQTRMHAVSVDEKEGPGRLDACDSIRI
jgi:hypothetical protein